MLQQDCKKEAKIFKGTKATAQKGRKLAKACASQTLSNMKKKQNIGVLAFQGDVIEHRKIIEKLGHNFIGVQTLKELAKIDRLIIPGGESTTIGLFLEQTGLGETIKKMASDHKNPLPIWGTCAGAIVLAKKIKSKIIPPHLDLMDITIQRNAYGNQIDSFTAKINIPKLKITNLESTFIRAPIILNVDPQVEILARHRDKIVLVKQNLLVAGTFHPELCGETRLHEWFFGL